MKGNWWWMFITKCSAPTPDLSSCTRYLYSMMKALRVIEITQLAPAWLHLQNIFTVNFIPYGKAQASEQDLSQKFPANIIEHLNSLLKTYGEGSSLSFSCQHGRVECEVCNCALTRISRDVGLLRCLLFPPVAFFTCCTSCTC